MGSENRLENKVALVTGAGSGMGRAIAQRFADEGASVALADIEEKTALQTIEQMAGGQDKHMACACDVGDSASVNAAFKKLRERYKKIDVLVNNAGIGTASGDGQERYMELMGQRGAELAEGKTPTVFADKTIYMEDKGWQRVVDVNLNGTFFCSRAAVSLMIDTNTAGSIVNISSTSALNGEGGLHYCASKAAIIGLTRAMAMELAPRNIRVNAVCPGPTDTAQMQGISPEWRQSIIAAVPLGRMAAPEEIAHTVLLLACAEGDLYTGQTLACNGGMQML
jgi:3-oxoacyl-[acyl-carrier protein] reductase